MSPWVSCCHSCQTLCNPMDCSPPSSSIYRILQARILKCVVMPSSRGSSWLRDRTPHLLSLAMAGRFFTTSATWGVLLLPLHEGKCPDLRLSLPDTHPAGYILHLWETIGQTPSFVSTDIHWIWKHPPGLLFSAGGGVSRRADFWLTLVYVAQWAYSMTS